MKTFFKLLTKRDGFTLVELMVVVAIIGILSAVAIPNFKKYQAKSKTSEAKLALAAIYSAETALQSDFDSFGHCLEFAGYEATGTGYYATGFGSGRNAANLIVRTNGGGGCANAQAIGYPGLKNIGGNVAAITDLRSASRPATDGQSFTADAAGYVSAGNGLDIWSIDEAKTMDHPTLGY